MFTQMHRQLQTSSFDIHQDYSAYPEKQSKMGTAYRNTNAIYTTVFYYNALAQRDNFMG